MKNVETSLSGDILTIRINTKSFQGPSKSGKTMVVASTEGNVSVPGLPPGLKLGVNCYTDLPKEAPKKP